MPNPFTKPKKTPEQMAADLAELRVTEAGLLRTYDELALAAADGGDLAAADRAHAALSNHRQTITRAEGVLQAVERRETANQITQKAKAIDDAWAATLNKARSRIALAERVQSALSDAGEAFAALTAGTAEVHRALPLGYPSHETAGFAIEAGLAAALVRLQLAKFGLPGGPLLAGFVPPPIQQRYTEAVQCIEQARELSREAATHG